MYEDPGWRLPRKSRNDPVTQVSGMRVMFMAFATGVVIFGLVVLLAIVNPETPPNGSGVGVAAVMLGVGVLAQLALLKLERPLDTSSEESLAASYRGRFIIRAAVGEGGALVGLVAALVTGQWWVLLIAAVIGAVGFTRAAPTATAIRRDEERLQAQGSPISLTAALWRPVVLEPR